MSGGYLRRGSESTGTVFGQADSVPERHCLSLLAESHQRLDSCCKQNDR